MIFTSGSTSIPKGVKFHIQVSFIVHINKSKNYLIRMEKIIF